MNIISEGDNYLAPLNYSSLFNKMLEVLQTQNPFRFSPDGKRLQINVDKIAYEVAISRVASPLTSASGVRSATVNFSDRFTNLFPKQVRQIRDCLRNHLNGSVPENGNSVEEIIAQLLTDLQSFQGATRALGFTYPFNEYPGLQKERLSLQRNRKGSDSLLKLHKLTITVKDIKGFDQQLRSSLENYIQQDFVSESEEDLEELEYTLEELVENPKSDFYKLKRVLNTEALGKLKREAKIRYLEYFLEHIDSDADGRVYLQDLIRRLRRIEEYISDLSREDGHYQVSYEGYQINYRDLFSRAEALDILPIIPLVEGYLGETTDEHKGEKQFIFGMKLKLGGTVPAQGDKLLPVLEYYLNLLDPDSKEHLAKLTDTFGGDAFKRKVLQIAFLYCFVFASRSKPLADNYQPNSELEYNPIPYFEKNVLPVLQGSDEIEKKKLFRTLKAGLEKVNVKEKITRLKSLFKEFLKRQSIWNRCEYPIHLGVKRGILERDFERIVTENTFFKPVFGEKAKEYLKYIAIREPHVDSSYLCNLSVNIRIEDIRYFPTSDRQTFSMAYDIKEIKTIPFLLLPLKEKSCQDIYNRFFLPYQPVLLVYDHQKFTNTNI